MEMYEMKLSDFEVRILDSDELIQAQTILKDEMVKRLTNLSKVAVYLNFAVHNGAKVFLYLSKVKSGADLQNPVSNKSVLESDILNFRAMDILIQHEPDFFELFFVNGNNILAIAEHIKAALEAKESLENKLNCSVPFNFYPAPTPWYYRAEDYLKTASALFDIYLKKEGNESLEFHKTQIDSSLAHLITCHADYMLNSKDSFFSNDEEGMFRRLCHVEGRVLKAVEIYENLLSKCVFHDEFAVYDSLVGLANAKALTLSQRDFDKGMAYFEEAKSFFEKVFLKNKNSAATTVDVGNIISGIIFSMAYYKKWFTDLSKFTT